MTTPMITDDLILKAHTASDGCVWYIDGDRLPENSGKKVADFLRSPVVENADHVRVIGMPDNAELLLNLHINRLRRQMSAVEVCSPLACASRSRRKRPDWVLSDLRRWAVPASCGGWHEFSRSDFISFALLSELRHKADPLRLDGLLRDHPVWYAVVSIEGVDRKALASLLASILDPRFFVDREDPDRLSKLEAYLGLDPKVAQNEGRSSAQDEQATRYRNVLTCWKNDDPGQHAAKVLPQQFLWRAYYEGGQGAKGDLRACQRLVHYLRHVWLDALYCDNPWKEPLFIPSYFFDADGVKWFNNQRKKAK